MNPGKTGTKAAARYVLEVPAGGCEVVQLRLAAARRAGSSARRSTKTLRQRLFDADEFYDRITPRSLSEDERRVHRQALAGMLWTKQYYYFDLDRWLKEHEAHPLLGGAQQRRPEHRVVPHAERRRHLDARQVGVPVVRGLGPRLPHDLPVARGLRLRQGAAAPDAAEPLHPPQRADARVRVELQRREPARCTPGRRCSSTRSRRTWAARTSLPGALVPGPDAQLQLVGEPEGPAGTERLRRRLPGPRQHRRLRPQRAAPHRRLPRAGGRHGLDGLLLPEHAGDGRHPRRPRPGLRGDRLQVPRELHLDLLRDGQGRRAARRHVGRGGRLLLRRAPPARTATRSG